MMNPSHREAIAATLPRKVPEDFWTELEQVFDVFRLVEGRRRSRPPTKRHKRWLRIAALAKKEGDDVLLEYAEARAVAYGMMGATFRGRNNFYRSHFLIGSVLDLWLRDISPTIYGCLGAPELLAFQAGH